MENNESFNTGNPSGVPPVPINSNQNPYQNPNGPGTPIPPVTPPSAGPVPPVSSPNADDKKSKTTLLIIIAVLAVALIAVGIFIFVKRDSLFGKKETTDLNDTAEEIGDEIVVVEAEESESADEPMTEEEYYAKQEEIINNSNNPSEVLLAKLDTASMHIAFEEYSEAEAIMNSLDTSSFSDEDFYRYYNVMARLYEGLGDSEKRDEAINSSQVYRARMQEAANAS